MGVAEDRGAVLHALVGAWYAREGRALPWRGEPDPYGILVSEVMLQQTQVARVIPVFTAFMERFPTLRALAEARAGDVITAWKGMGYNSRAVRLQQMARMIVTDHAGEIPRSPELLRNLPGIGPYTASAVACFAFGANVPVLDTNIYRVLSRLFHGVDAPSRAALEPLALELVPGPGAPLTASDWAQGLMDIGAMLCTAQRPRCMPCPLRKHCAAFPALHNGDRELADRSVPYSPKQSLFAGSTRYYRGRVIDALRAAGPAGLPRATVETLIASGKKPEAILASLVRDGLAVEDEGVFRLP